MKKLSVTIQWLALAALAAFVAYVAVRPTPQPLYAPETWRSWDGVTVLSFAGIARRDSPVYPSVKRLEAQLNALRSAGYRTVRPEDVRAYLDERAPLPDKALLLIFEGGRKEAFIRATPVLQRTGFTAVLAVPTTVLDQWGGFYLKRADIRKLVRMPQWQVGSMGHRAIQPLPGSAEATEGRFLARRIRLANGQAESADAFRGRIEADYACSVRTLEEAAGKPPLLYLYPFGEAGQSPGADPLAAAVNRDAVSRTFGLAFVGGARAFNGPGSDPWSLTRLRVRGDWSPEQLLAELAADRPRRTPQDSVGSAQDWSFEQKAELRNGEICLADSSAAWLRGTDAWGDTDVTVALTPAESTRAALYARYASARSWLRVTTGADELRVQECMGDRLFTLCRKPLAAPGGLQLRLRLRNNRAWVWLNGQPAAENLPLSSFTRRGRIGFGAEQGDLRITAFSARPIPARWVLFGGISGVAEALREQVQAVVPNAFRAGEAPAFSSAAQHELLTCAVSGIQTYPLISGGGALDEEAARRWAEAIDAELVRTDTKPLVPCLAVEGPAPALVGELRDRRYRLVHLLTPDEALTWGRSIARENRDEVIVINGTGDAVNRAADWLLRTTPAYRVAVRDTDSAALAPNLASVGFPALGGEKP